MTDLIQLSDAEIAAVAGGDVDQSISIHASQSNRSSVDQDAHSSNSGNVSATTGAGAGGTATAVGSAASNTAWVSQSNAIIAANVFSIRRS